MSTTQPEQDALSHLTQLFVDALGLDQESAQDIASYVFTNVKENNTITNIQNIFQQDGIDLSPTQIQDIHSIIGRAASSSTISDVTKKQVDDDITEIKPSPDEPTSDVAQQAHQQAILDRERERFVGLTKPNLPHNATLFRQLNGGDDDYRAVNSLRPVDRNLEREIEQSLQHGQGSVQSGSSRGRPLTRSDSPPPPPPPRRYERDDRSRDYDMPPPPPPPPHLLASVESSANQETYPRQYQVYKGTVISVTPKQCQVALRDFPNLEVILPAAAITADNARADPRNYLKRDQTVFVKVLTDTSKFSNPPPIDPSRSLDDIHIDTSVTIAVSMRDVDQITGYDLKPTLSISNGAGSASNAGVSGLNNNCLERVLKVGGKRVRSSSQERWAKQQMLSGHNKATSANSNPTQSFIAQDDLSDDDDDADVDLADVEPAFMRGMAGGLNLLTQSLQDSIKLVQIPDGSLQKAALTQQTLAKERREMKNQMLVEQGDALPQDLHKGWVDPLSTTENRYLAADLKSVALAAANNNRNTDGTDPHEATASMLDSVVTYGKVTSKSIKEQREELPVFQLRQQFLDAIGSHQTLVVVGETGSGKTTQMAQYLYEEGYGRHGIICCTQPRRVAATSVAQRVSEEVGCQVGTTVGYSVRFDECTSHETKIKFMTDGMLLREILLDPKLNRYSVIIIDEAHERSVNTDILLALVKAAAKARPELKFIVTSATLDAERFATYLGGCPIFSIPGRSYPITVLYSTETETDYLESALETVISIHLQRPPGDILVFLTGKEEIDSAVETLKDRIKQLGRAVPPLDVYPVYSSLPNEIQSKIFEPTPVGRRKCVLSTNIAEASITIDGIIYVVDTGFCKLKVYDSKIGMESLQVTPISQAQAKQRAGRAGRTRAGFCYRLYTEMAYHHEMTPTAVPELQRCDLASVLLILKAMGVNDLLNFDFIDPPSTSSMLFALQRLFWLGAVDSEGILTEVGARLSMMPVTPDLGKMLLVAADIGCVQEIATVVAMVSGEEIWTRPKNEQAKADRQRATLSLREGDHPTLVRVYKEWEKAGKTNQWCVRHFISSRAMNTAANVRSQLLRTLAKMRIELSSCGDNWGLISRAVTAGLFMNAAKKEHVSAVGQAGSTPSYKTFLHGNTAFLHPASSLYSQMPQYIVYQKMLFTTKEYLHTATVIHPQWLIQLAPHLFTARSDKAGQDSGPRIRERLQPLSDRFNQPDAWRLGKRKG